jgi:hypothetical protein
MMARLTEGLEIKDIEGELVYPTKHTGLKHDYLAIYSNGKRICEGTSSFGKVRVVRNFVLYCFGSKNEELIGRFRLNREGEGVGYGRFKGGYVMGVWPRREMVVHHSNFRLLWHQYGGYPSEVSSLKGYIDRPTNWPSFLRQWTHHSGSKLATSSSGSTPAEKPTSTVASTVETLNILGGTYTGEVVDGRPHGKGKWTHSMGLKYIGEWKDNKRHGQGNLTWADGDRDVGQYKDGKFWEGIRYLASGEIRGTYSNGVWCKGCKPTARQLAIVREINSSQISDATVLSSELTTASESTASTSSKVWCANASNVFQTTKAHCKSRQLKSFSTKAQAQAEQQRLKGLATASSSGYRIYCYDPSLKLFFRVSGKCADTDRTVSEQEYSQERLKGTTTASGPDYVWCATSKQAWRTTTHACKSSKGKNFSLKYQAEAEHQRLKGLATASTSSKVWCADASNAFQTTKTYCNWKNGESFSTKSQAQAEHQRLKAVATASSNQTSQETTVQTGSTENIFWQSIKDSNDADMYREYLRQFPSGVYAGLAKLKIKKLDGDTQVVNASIPNLDYGDYYALVIGNNEYPGLSNLRSAVGDARAVSNVLEVNYGFKVDHLENATRSQILKSIGKLRANVTRKDNVLIYYAGHGHLDQAADEGYWLPIDADRSDQSNWIATDRIVSQVKAMQAKHVMVVADSCFSGTITRAIKIEQRTPEWLSEIVKKKARTALTSGGLEPVMDTGSGNHSAFAYAFISLLEENDGVLDASQLFSKLRPKVMVNSTQTPQYGKIHMAGDDGGDFLFVRR